MKKTLSGFTLIDLMISLLILSILAGIAIPSYRDYVKRGYLVNATNTLAAQRVLMEQYYQDNRTYANSGGTYPCTSSTVGPSGATFHITCTSPAPTTSTYTITATGSGQVEGFVYTIDQGGTQKTSGLPSGWGSASTSCWIVKKGQAC
jgi:type IV pilus assembly protein PilE